MSFQHYVVSVASGEAYDFFIVARGACLCYDDARLARRVAEQVYRVRKGIRYFV